MRSIIALALVLLASTVSAGSIRPAACTTSTAQDSGLKDFIRKINRETCASVGLPSTCTDAQAKTVNPAVTIWDISAAGYQIYSGTYYCSAVTDHAAQGMTWRNSKNLGDAYLSASPSVQAQVDALLGIQ